MLKFLARIFGTERSGQMAKERLKLVLLSDHLSLAPEVVDALKSDLLAVIERYVEIDASHVVVDFEHRDHEIALTANVPIIAMRERPLPPPVAAPALTLVPPVRSNGIASANGNGATTAPVQTHASETPAAEAPAADVHVAEEPVQATAAPAPAAETPPEASDAQAPPEASDAQAPPEASDAPSDLATPPSDAVAAPPGEVQAAASAEYPAELPGVNAAPRTLPATKQRTRRRRRKGGAAPVNAPPLGNAAKA